MRFLNELVAFIAVVSFGVAIAAPAAAPEANPDPHNYWRWRYGGEGTPHYVHVWPWKRDTTAKAPSQKRDESGYGPDERGYRGKYSLPAGATLCRPRLILLIDYDRYDRERHEDRNNDGHRGRRKTSLNYEARIDDNVQIIADILKTHVGQTIAMMGMTDMIDVMDMTDVTGMMDTMDIMSTMRMAHTQMSVSERRSHSS
jgi:hypothetical protein